MDGGFNYLYNVIYNICQLCRAKRKGYMYNLDENLKIIKYLFSSYSNTTFYSAFIGVIIFFINSFNFKKIRFKK